VTGANRGLGLEWVTQLAERDDTIVIAVVRSVEKATALKALGKKNVHVVKGDIADVASIETAATETSRITGGTLDVLINNAAQLGDGTTLGSYVGKGDQLVEDLEFNFHANVTGPILTTNAFLPLLKAGKAKRVITISSGLGDPDAILTTGFLDQAPYCISKAAITMVNAKYAVEFKDQGFTFVALSPGLVDTSTEPPTPEQIEAYQEMSKSFKKLSPTFTGPIKPKESISMQLKVLDNLTPEDTGKFLSHHGNKEWL